MVSRRLTPGIQVERTYLSQTDYTDLYAAEVPASGPAGSILAYRPDVYHRGVRMTAPRSARFMVHVSYKPANTDWLGAHGLPSAAEDMSWYRFVQHADERQLTVLGFPPPGHPYWTAETLSGVAARYPMLDLSPWREAAAGKVEGRRDGRGRAVVEDRRPLPDLSAVLRRQQRRRRRRHPGHHRASGPPGMARRRRDLALPVTISPNADWGYDVADFCAIAPEFGTLEDFDRLVAEAGRAWHPGPDGHRAEPHERTAPMVRRLAFVTDVGPPGLVCLGGRQAGRRAPEQLGQQLRGTGLDSRRGDRPVLLPQPSEEQPDLNWWNEEVRATFDDIFRFWSDRGVAGFRIDVGNVIIKDAELRDNPPATEDDDFETQMFGQRSVYNANRPEVHEVIRRWRMLADAYEEPRLLIGETPVPLEKLADFYGDGTDELGLAFNFNFITAPFQAPEMRTIVEETEAALPPGAWPAWTGSNHDMFRFPDPLGRRRPGQGPPGPPHAAVPARHTGPLPGRRDRHGERRAGAGGPPRPARGALLPVLRGA